MSYPKSPVDKAIELALVAHAGQLDKSGAPYYKHPLRVMRMCQDEEEIVEIVAVLHDVVEDTSVKLTAIYALFGREVGDAVDAISRRTGEKYWDYIERCSNNPIALKVKLCDLRDNMSPERQNFEGSESLVGMYTKALKKLEEKVNEGR